MKSHIVRSFLVAILMMGMIVITGCTLKSQTTAQPNTVAPAVTTEDELNPTASDEEQLEVESSSTVTIDTDGIKATSTQSAPGTTVNPVKEFTITAKNWEFLPGTITVNKGDRVRLKITSVDVNHGFAIADFNINQVLTPGKTEIVEFTADKAGQFTFFCSVPCGGGHREMKGVLIVK